MVLAEISRRKCLVTAGAVVGVSVVRPQSFYGASPQCLPNPIRMPTTRDQANQISSEAYRVCNYL